MDRKKAYVFGGGQYFKNKQPSIIAKYEIEAVLDNNRAGELELLNGKSVPILRPDEAENSEIPIIIMVCDFYHIWMELKQLSVNPSRIIFPNRFLPYTNDEQIFNSEKGEFRIMGDDIYYVDQKRKYIIDSAEILQNLAKQLERDRMSAAFLTEQAPVNPLNREFGFSRGTPIDRYFIENWLEKKKELIRGDVLEIAEDTYTRRFGGKDAVSHILHVSLEKEGFIKGNLETGEGIPENAMDCIILTQTLPFIFGCEKVISNLYQILRKGGTVLLTTGGITQISRYDMDRWGHFWSFTAASLKRLIEESEFGENYEMTVYGNVKTACALMYGVAAEELTSDELSYTDEDYSVSICAVVKK